MPAKMWIAAVAALCLNTSASLAASDVKLYSWSDYFGSDTIEKFSKETGSKVIYDVFDSNDLVETKLLSGKTGYDVITPNLAPHFARQLSVGVWAELDQDKLPNRVNMDPGIMAQLDKFDPGVKHAMPWMWGTTGIIMNMDKIHEIMPDAPVDSWKMLFDPAIVSKFKDCGVIMLDDGEQVLGSALIYLGKELNSATDDDLKAAVSLMDQIRPNIRKFHSSEYISGLAQGDYCLALGFSGDARVATLRAEEAGAKFKIEYRLPKEGALMYFDVLAVPYDADNKEGAEQFINFVMRPEVAAKAANDTGFATANKAAMAMVDPALTSDLNLYPSSDTIAKLTVPRVRSPKELKVWTHAWQEATGQR